MAIIRSVKPMKELFEKGNDSGDRFLAMLDYKNAPSQGEMKPPGSN